MKKNKLVSLIREAQEYAKKNSGKDWRKLDENKLSIFLRNGVKTNDYDILLDVIPEWGGYYDEVNNADDGILEDVSSDYKQPWKAPLKVAVVIEDYETGEATVIDYFDNYAIENLLEDINKDN